jgi:hypothetical protein
VGRGVGRPEQFREEKFVEHFKYVWKLLVNMTLEEALQSVDEKYDLSRNEYAKEVGRSVACLRD